MIRSEIANNVNSRTYLFQQMLRILLHENMQNRHAGVENRLEIVNTVTSQTYLLHQMLQIESLQ